MKLLEVKSDPTVFTIFTISKPVRATLGVELK